MKYLQPLAPLSGLAIIFLTMSAMILAKDAGTQTTQPADGSILLDASNARIHGFQMHIDRKPEPHFVYWVDPAEYLEWVHGGQRTGTFAVELTYSCANGAGGNFVFTASTARLTGRAEPTGGWEKTKTVRVGEIALDQAPVSAFLKADGAPRNALMSLWRIRLVPQPKPPSKK